MEDARPRHGWLKASVVVAVTIVMTILVLFHVSRVNGPPYWVWAWRRVPTWWVLPAFAIAGLPAILAVLLFDRHGKRPRTAALLLPIAMLSCFALKLVSAAAMDPADPLA